MPNQVDHERAHFETQTKLSMKAGATFRAMLTLATGFEWKTSDGAVVRVEPFGDVWVGYVNGKPVCTKRRADAAIDAAARLAPPADAELARAITWTACGRPRA